MKSFLLQCALAPLVTGGLVFVIKWGGAYFYIYAWLFVLVVSLVRWSHYMLPLYIL